MKVWVVITPDGEQLPLVGNWKQRLLRRFPRVGKDGMVRIQGLPYVVNPNRFVREHWRPMRYLGLVEKEAQYQYWLQNEPDPITFNNKMTPGSIGVTGETIAQYAKSQHLQRLVQPETNWLMYAIIFMAIAIIAEAAIIYNLTR